MTKQQAIIESAVELFAKYGIEGTSVQQITSHCGISKGAFYLSFKSKEALIVAILDYFMEHVITEVDQAVRNEQNTERIFYIYFQKTLQSIAANKGIAHIFLNEPLHKMGIDIIEKVHMYDAMHNETIHYMFHAAYKGRYDALQYDMPYIVKGLLHAYMVILLTSSHALQFDVLSESLAEKVDVIVRHSKKPYMTSPIPFEHTTPCTFVAIEQAIEQLLTSTDDAFLQQSLRILQQELQKEVPNVVIIEGMLANCARYKECHILLYFARHWQAQQATSLQDE